jgi:hypothetical protein
MSAGKRRRPKKIRVSKWLVSKLTYFFDSGNAFVSMFSRVQNSFETFETCWSHNAFRALRPVQVVSQYRSTRKARTKIFIAFSGLTRAF